LSRGVPELNNILNVPGFRDFLKSIISARKYFAKWKWRDDFFENGRLLTYSSVSQIFEFGFGTPVRSLPDALRLATTPKKRLPGAGGGFLKRECAQPRPIGKLGFNSHVSLVEHEGVTTLVQRSGTP